MTETQRPQRRNVDIEITTLIMGVERLNENIITLSEDQKIMSKELAKIGEVLIKMDHINERHLAVERRVVELEDNRKKEGCPILQKLTIECNALKKECDASISVIRGDVEAIDDLVKKIIWAVASVVALALSSAFFGLVLK